MRLRGLVSSNDEAHEQAMNYKHTFLFCLINLLALARPTGLNAQARWPMERLDRGVVALPAQGKGCFISWRLLGYDSPDITFDVLRNGHAVAQGLRLTNFTDPAGSPSDRYAVVSRQQGRADTSAIVAPWTDVYTTLRLNRPKGGKAPDGRAYEYRPNDCSVGDVDGDGQYELIVKWDPTNSHDNAHDGFTGNVLLDCYEFSGKQLWRIDLGPNIRAGAHYTQFLVFDFDGDGHAEMMCKTAPGSIDGQDKPVSDAATDPEIRAINNARDYRNNRGRILKGPELLTVFDGFTGKALHTVWYNPNRGFTLGGDADYGDWGDRAFQGNRGERFLACVAYLDGADKLPSAVFCRGYYTRSYLWAVDFRDGRLHTHWLHASTSPNEWTLTDSLGHTLSHASGLKATAYSQGAHSLAVGDVDGDDCDEITYGSAAIDNDGTLLYSTGLGHGDAQHLADLDPDRPGLEYYMVHEAAPYGADLRDARTGEILWRETGNEDTGRGLAADIDATHRGQEMWNSAHRAVRDCHGNLIADTWPPMNFRIYWDGDLQDELLGNSRKQPFFPPRLMKWDGKQATSLPLSDGRQLGEAGHSATCNWTKATPCLQADILGDWREELIFFDRTDPSVLNIFTTAMPTAYRVPTLMHDHVYRMGVAWQNVSYNQPPHLGYYLPDKAKKAE
jgi:rhamnogalacturonan endolyase